MNSEEESVRIFCFPSPRCVVLFRVLVHPLVLESRNTHSCSPNLSKRCRLIRPHALLEHRTKKKKDKPLPFAPLSSPSESHTHVKKRNIIIIIIMYAVASSAKVVAPTMRMQKSQTKRVVAKVPVKASSFNVEKVRRVVVL
jgi:hypothetical protein